MNTKFKLGLGLAFAMVLGACSADSIDAPMSENWPADFSTAEYAKANPDLGNYQIIAVIADSNNAYMEIARQKMIDSLLQATAAKKAPEPLAASDTSNAKSKAAKFSISMNDESEVAVFFDDSTAVKTIFTVYAGLSEAWWPGFSALKNGMTDEEGNINIDGLRATEYRTAFKNFHRYGFAASQDLAFIQSIANKIDSSLIEKQFIMAGRYEGRPYRMCRDTDFKNPAVKTKKLDVTVVKDSAGGKWGDFKYKDTTYLVEAEKSTWKYVLTDGSECVSEQACSKKIEEALKLDENSDLAIKDTIKPEPIEKHDSVRVDSTWIWKQTTTIAPLSPNAVAPAANKNRVWDFSADLYCRNEADWEIYLIENP